MDHWSHSQILNMLEGGNRQLAAFFERNKLSTTRRYFTKAAQFYRLGMQKHVEQVSQQGYYRGRKVNHERARSPTSASSPKTTPTKTTMVAS